MATQSNDNYSAKDIKVLEGLEGVRKRFNVIELSKKIKKRGDVLILSQELKIKPRTLNLAKDEGRVLNKFPELQKSKAAVLAALKTDRELSLFSKRYNIYNLSARNLIKLIKKWKRNIQEDPLLMLSQQEYDLIMGSLMGDSSVRQREKNSCFRFSHSIKQKAYCDHKKRILNEFNISEFREVKRKINENFIHAIDFSTKTHQAFNYFRRLFYESGKKAITSEILGKLNPQSLAFWICDDGSYCRSVKYMILCTNSYSLGEHKLMVKFFKEKFSISPKIGFRDGKYYYLRFNKKDTQKLAKIIRPFIPLSMKYKIGEE